MPMFSTIQNKFATWLTQFTTNAPRILAALVILIAFYALSKFAKKLVKRGLRHSEAPAAAQTLVARLAAVGVFIAGFIIALSVLGLQKAVTTALAGAGVLGIVLGFAFQDIAANFISGVFLVFRKPFREGDIVEIGDHVGSVETINLRATKLHKLDGRMVYIPNSDVFGGDIVNYSELGRQRVNIECGVSYTDNLKQATEVARSSIQELDVVDTNQPVEVYFNEFGGSSINFVLRFWVQFDSQADMLAAQDEAIQSLKRSFAENDIDIPFPIRTLNADEDLEAHLQKLSK